MIKNARIFENPEDIIKYLIEKKDILPNTIREIKTLKNVSDPIDSILINDPYFSEKGKKEIEKKYNSSKEFVAETKDGDEITFFIRKLEDRSFDCFISNIIGQYYRI